MYENREIIIKMFAKAQIALKPEGASLVRVVYYVDKIRLIGGRILNCL